jgi:acyl-CoA synthetase (AMP-forming)/AMP-acid ligase II
MLQLTEQQVRFDIVLLGQAWEGEDTFVLLPDKCAFSTDWLDRALKQLPEDMLKGHFVLLTSGSTGLPKLVIGSRRRAEDLVQVLHELQESQPVRETILALPLSYCYAFVNQWLWARQFRRRLCVTEGLSQPDSLLDNLVSADEAMICLVGIQVPLLLGSFSGRSFPGVIRVHFAGGRFPFEKLPTVRELFPMARIFNNYGCAEAMPRLTIRRAEEIREASDIGMPLPGVELTYNEMDELLFRSRYGAVGVVDEQGFRPILPDTWVKTGDLASRTDGGGWRLLGRSNEVFKRYGEKVSLPMLLSTINRSWAGQAVFYRERDSQGEEGHVLVLTPAPTPGQLQAVMMSLRGGHPRAQWPLRIESVPLIPLLSNGKPDIAAIAHEKNKIIHWYQRI